MERKWITEIGKVMHFAATLLLYQNETGSTIDRIKFDFSTATARRLEPNCATRELKIETFSGR